MEKISKKGPLISVIIPLYNKGPYIKRAIRSVLTQTIQDFEIIVVEGGSTDNSLEMVRAFDDPRLYVIQQVDKGVSAARNEGVQVAKSDFLAFLDADDEWMPGFIETVLRLKNTYPDAGAYFTAVKEKGLNKKGSNNDEKSHTYSFVPFEGWEGLIENYFLALLYGDPLYYPSSLALCKGVFLENGGFPQGAVWGEDQDLCGRIALRNSIAFSSHICSIIHKTDEYVRVMRKRIASTEEHPFINPARKAISDGEVPDYLVRDLKSWINELVLFSVRYNLIAGNPAGARKILKRYKIEGIFRKKIWNEIWSLMPTWTFNMGGYSLFDVCSTCILFIKRIIKS
jgi:glycosyltransferase involved in cell wall biosynthesis